MSDPFSLISTFICQKGMHPEIVVGPYAKSPSDIRILSISAKDSTRDWLTEFLHDEDAFEALSQCCDFSVQNNGKMLVIEPKHFHLLPDRSLSSLTTQFGSLMSLAHDCNWDTTHCHPMLLPGTGPLSIAPIGCTMTTNGSHICTGITCNLLTQPSFSRL